MEKADNRFIFWYEHF